VELNSFSSPGWANMAEQAVGSGISINVFLAPQQDGDLATLGGLSRNTGGDLIYYPKFTPQRDAHRLHRDCIKVYNNFVGHTCSLRLRASKGSSCNTLMIC
jgi:protein transport protein SEC24